MGFRLSKNSQSAYLSDIKKYTEFLQSKNTQPAKATSAEIREFILDRRTRSMESSTIAREVSSIRTFHKFLCIEGYSDENPGDNIYTPRLIQKIPQILATKQIDLLLAVIPKKRESDIRLRAMIELTYATGMRVSEVVSLEISQIDFEHKYIQIFGKGRKERTVMFGESARTAILQYLNTRKNWESKFLFPTKLNKPMSRQEFWRQLHTLAKGAGISETLSPHTLRHSFATHMMNRGVNLNYIRELLGHSSLNTTQIYTKIIPQDLKNAHEKFHPRGKEIVSAGII